MLILFIFVPKYTYQVKPQAFIVQPVVKEESFFYFWTGRKGYF